MEENLLTVVRADETESAVADDSFDCALHRHLDWGKTKPVCGGSITSPVKTPLSGVGATLPARGFIVKGTKMGVGKMSCGSADLRFFRFERFDRGGQIFIDVEDGTKAGNFQELLHAARQVK